MPNRASPAIIDVCDGCRGGEPTRTEEVSRAATEKRGCLRTLRRPTEHSVQAKPFSLCTIGGLPSADSPIRHYHYYTCMFYSFFSNISAQSLILHMLKLNPTLHRRFNLYTRLIMTRKILNAKRDSLSSVYKDASEL
ncbi:hypothetical protein U9M48_001800 [Paspalum notatum var. saurae]|uniref:Uncharacterized protein n=1 Tax=Paspalum notatum var. saurae TaxID=547442 RepID=A0AAQ3SD49_PASNO